MSFKVEVHRKTLHHNYCGDWIDASKIFDCPIQPLPGLVIDLGKVRFRCHDLIYLASQNLWIVKEKDKSGYNYPDDLATMKIKLEEKGWTVVCSESVLEALKDKKKRKKRKP
ncbi:MAG: hypothetical protein ACTSW7_00540 [Candidatus Thorarchaeota archaeon]|nr:MAG: hypothetical protein DRP42_02800 [Mycoplasmatota bacterium]HEC72611.1 hypothetical protein [Thermoplasmatales archaeon]